MRVIQFNFIKITLFFFLISHLSATSHAKSDFIEIEVGKDQILKVEFTVEKAVSGNPSVCSPEMKDGGEVLIRGLKPGRTNIHVFGTGANRKEFSVIVVDPDIMAKARELKQILRRIKKVKVDVMEGRSISVHAEVYSKKDLKRVERILKYYPDVKADIGLNPVYYDIMAKEIKATLSDTGISNLIVTPMRNKFVVKGIAPTPELRTIAGELLKAIDPDIVNGIIPKNPTPPTLPREQIKMNMKIMEVEKNALRDYGVHWNPGGTLTAGGSYSGKSDESATLAGSITTFISNLFPKMRKIEEEGRGRTVFNQDILVRNGGQGMFFRGGEVPFLVAQRDGIMSTEFKKIGVTLQCTPSLVSNNDIHTTFNIEASRITGEGPGGAPIVATNNLNTDVIIPVGQSIALGGAIGQMELKLLSKSPRSTKDDYSLFQLNKANRNEMQNSEVIILVTPQLFDSSKPVINSPEDRIKQQELDYMRSQLKKNQ